MLAPDIRHAPVWDLLWVWPGAGVGRAGQGCTRPDR